MNLQNPASFLWLLPLGGLILALYLLRMRRKDVEVPAVFLWPQRTEEVRANAFIQKLRFSWLLVLQLLALLALLFALAKPQIRQRGLSGKVTVAVLDASASMGARDEAPSRFLSAKKSVAEMIGSAAPGDRLALIEAGPTPRVVFPLSQDPGPQKAALESVHNFDAESDMGEALRLASAIASDTDGAKIVVLSDGVFEPVADFNPGKASVVYFPFGTRSENLAIQALGVTEGPQGPTAYCGVKNYGNSESKTGVTFRADGKVIDSTNASVLPGQVWGHTFRVPLGTRVVEAKLDAKDLLSADDYAVTLTDQAASLKVLLVTEGDIFLEKALALDPRVTLDKATNLPKSQKKGAPGDSLYDVIVFDGVAAEPTKSRGQLVFGGAGSLPIVDKHGTARQPHFLNATDDPVIKGVDLQDTYIESIERVTPKGSGKVVAEAKEGPLVVVSSGSQKQVYVAFKPMESDFPLSFGFPILVGNALDFLANSNQSVDLAVKVGQTFTVPANDADTAELSSDNGSVVIPARDDRITVRQADHVGPYRLKVGKSSRTIYATLRSSVESQIAPQKVISVGSVSIAQVSELTRFEDYWRWAIILGLAVLGFEWWYFARRS